MQRYFIHCYWHLDGERMCARYLGRCTEREAREKFTAAIDGNQEFELLTLYDGGGHEIQRHVLRSNPPNWLIPRAI